MKLIEVINFLYALIHISPFLASCQYFIHANETPPESFNSQACREKIVLPSCDRKSKRSWKWRFCILISLTYIHSQIIVAKSADFVFNRIQCLLICIKWLWSIRYRTKRSTFWCFHLINFMFMHLLKQDTQKVPV